MPKTRPTLNAASEAVAQMQAELNNLLTHEQQMKLYDRLIAVVEGMKASAIAKVRSIHDAVIVDGKKYSSLYQAFKAKGLPTEGHEEFRRKVKIKGEATFIDGNRKVTFTKAT